MPTSRSLVLPALALRTITMCKTVMRRILSFFVSLFFFFVLFVANCQAQNDATDIPSHIEKIFPTATRVGETHTDIAVTPVYQLQQLLGYVFESNDFVDFIGFSGKPVNVVVGLDPQGNFVDLFVKEHSEPIFLHGLGEQAMFDFVAQYKSHNIKERFIIGGKSNVGNDATYFDGVTKATVSVLVINDTIVTSALAVARAKLDGFIAPSNKIIAPDFFEPLSFEALLEKGYIHKHTIDMYNFDGLEREVIIAANEAFEINDSSVQNSEENLNSTQNSNQKAQIFSQHYYAFLSIPIVGRNLLGDDEYQRLKENLKPGELALLVVNTQGFSFISPEFIPQTTPEHLQVLQGGFPIALRDIDFYSFYEPSFTKEIPQYKDIKVLRIKSKGGLSLDQPMDIAISLPFKPSFFEQDEHLFSFNFTLPNELFIENPEAVIAKPEPLWIKIWRDRTVEISITVVYLMSLSVFFAAQRKLTKHTTFVHTCRAVSLVFVMCFIGFYAQGQLSVVNIYTLLLDLVDGFSIDVYLLDPVIFILWCFVFVSLFLVGRGLFCGWLCPFGAMQEIMAVIAKRLRISQIKIKPQHHRYGQAVKYVLLLGLIASSFYSLTLAEKLAELEPFKTAVTLHFVRYWPFVLYAVMLLVLSLKIHKVYCRYLCPLGAGLAIVGRFPIVKLLDRRAECGSPCQLCKQKMCGIDAIKSNGQIDYGECIQCLECVITLNNSDMCKIDKYKKKKVPTRVKNLNSVSA